MNFIWLLVLIFSTNGEPVNSHVFAQFDKEASCQLMAKDLNKDGPKLQRKAICVPWYEPK